jgi:phosphoglucosamine mutase
MRSLSGGWVANNSPPMPTPAIAYLTQTYGATAGVVISASHNHFRTTELSFSLIRGLKTEPTAQPNFKKKSAVIGFMPTLPRMPSVPK